MDCCPYCGESIPPKAVQCPKCGVVLDEDAAGDAPAAAPSAPARVEAPRKTQPCPRCGKPVWVKAHRCRACGHKTREIVDQRALAEEAAFRRTVRLGTAGAVLLAILAVVAVGWLRSGEGRAKRDFVRVSFEDLSAMVGPGAKTSESRKKTLWAKYARKDVRWEGRVARVERGGIVGDAALLLRHRDDGPGDPEVRLSLPDREVEAKGVEVGRRVSYVGRLAAYGSGSPAFTLEEGEVVSVRD